MVVFGVQVREPKKDFVPFKKSFELPLMVIAAMGQRLAPKLSQNKTTRVKFFLMDCLRVFNCMVMVCSLITHGGYLFESTATFLEITYTVPCMGYSILSLSKMITVSRNRAKLNEMIENLENNWPNIHDNEADVGEVNKEIKSLCSLTKMISNLNIGGILLFDVMPIIQMSFEYFMHGHISNAKQLPFYMWMPFDRRSQFGYPLAYFIQCFMCYEVFGMAAIDILFITINANICIQFKLLQSNLINIVEHIATAGLNLNQDQHDTLNIKLNKCIKLHAQLIGFSKTVEEIFSPSILINFMTSSVIICLVGFQATQSDNLPDVTKCIVFLSCALVQIFMLCSSGNALMLASVGVCDAAYNGAWYVTDARFRRSLNIIMKRAQKPEMLTAMKFSVVSLESFMTILKTSYSYFALLETVYKGPEE